MKKILLKMKKLLIIIFLLPNILSAQVHTEWGAGYEHVPVGKIAMGYTTGKIMMEAMVLPGLSRKINANTYYGVQAGINLKNIVPSVGYFYNYRSADDVSLNKWVGLTAGIKVIVFKYFYAEVIYINKNALATAGFHADL